MVVYRSCMNSSNFLGHPNIQAQKPRCILPSNPLQHIRVNHTALFKFLKPSQPILALRKRIVHTIHNPIMLRVPQHTSHGIQRPVTTSRHPQIRIPHLSTVAFPTVQSPAQCAAAYTESSHPYAQLSPSLWGIDQTLRKRTAAQHA